MYQSYHNLLRSLPVFKVKIGDVFIDGVRLIEVKVKELSLDFKSVLEGDDVIASPSQYTF